MICLIFDPKKIFRNERGNNMAYKYENVESVEVKESFELHTFDENGEITETFKIMKGTQGIFESRGYEIGDPVLHYYNLFDTKEYGKLDVSLYESDFEKRLHILKIAN